MKPRFLPAAALLLGLAVLPALPASAQADAPPNPPSQTDGPPGPPPDGPRPGNVDHRVQRLTQALGLSADQAAQMKVILSAEQVKMEALHSNTALTREERHAQGEALHQDTSAKVHALLTADQASRYDALEARMRERRPQGGEAPPPPPDGPGN